MFKKIIIFIAILLIFPLSLKASEKEINLYLFYGKECPHCEIELEYLDEYLANNPNLHLIKYEVWHNSDNQKLMKNVKNYLNYKNSGVPLLIIGKQAILGFGEGITESNIESVINYYYEHDYVDAVADYLSGKKNEDEKSDENILNEEIKLPIVGKIKPRDFSLGVLAIIIGSVDGFNPCAMWILIFLISMLFGMKDKKKMWTLGILFLITSALIYLLFMVSWLNLALFMSGITIIRIIIGLVAMVFGILNIRNFLNNKDGECKVVNPKQRLKFMGLIKKITGEQKFILSIIGIITLACLVNVVELLCSLGLPVVFTQVLSLYNLNKFEYALYLLIYIFFFLIDDIIVFILSMKALNVTTMSHKYAKYSNLIGGIVMIIIGILMIFKMEWLMFNF